MTTPAALAPVTYENIGTSTGFQIANVSVNSFNVYNGDTSNVVLVSRDVSPQLSNSIPIQPLTNGTITGRGTWYASALSGTIASLTVSSSTFLQPSPAQIASQIALGGIPLISSSVLLDQQSNITIAPNASNFRGPFNVTGTSYEIQISSFSQAGVTAAVLLVTLQWTNALTGLTTGQDSFWFYGGNNSSNPHVITGKGPTKGNTVFISVTAFAAAIGSTYSYAIFQNNRVYTKDTWRTISMSQIAGFTPPGGFDPNADLLASNNVSVNAGQTLTYILPFYTGQVSILLVTTSATSDALLSISNVGDLSNLGPIPQPILFTNGSNSVGTLFQSGIFLPRSQCTVAVRNNNAAAKTLSFYVGIAEQEA